MQVQLLPLEASVSAITCKEAQQFYDAAIVFAQPRLFIAHWEGRFIGAVTFGWQNNRYWFRWQLWSSLRIHGLTQFIVQAALELDHPSEEIFCSLPVNDEVNLQLLETIGFELKQVVNEKLLLSYSDGVSSIGPGAMIVDCWQQWTDHFAQRPKGITIDTIIIHSMHRPEGDSQFDLHRCKAWLDHCGVSSHYLIDRYGTILQTVADDALAWHAGKSKMPSPDERENVNDFSIGIELIGCEELDFTPSQYGALNVLLSDLLKRWPISSIYGHNDIAPQRKTDPWGLDWRHVLLHLEPAKPSPLRHHPLNGENVAYGRFAAL